jgi:hypothetical protein
MSNDYLDEDPDVEWPAVLIYAGEDELLVIGDGDEWLLDPALHVQPYDDRDRLVDSNGVEYRFGYEGAAGEGRASLAATGVRLTPAEFQEIAARHVTASGAPGEWLAAHLQDIPDSQKIRSAIRYVERVDADHTGDGLEEDEEGH